MASIPKQKQIAGLVSWLAVVFIAAAIGAAASVQAGPFYMQLVRPGWAPPPAIFGPVWTVLYALMGVAAWLVWRVAGLRAAKPALTLFLAQLALNAVWSWLFFAWHRGALAFADIIVLWALIIATVFLFWRIRPLAGARVALWAGPAIVGEAQQFIQAELASLHQKRGQKACHAFASTTQVGLIQALGG